MTRAALIAIVFVAATAAADPIRLRGDALATTTSPAGLLVLNAEGSVRDRLSAEAVVWMGGEAVGDVLVIAVRARTRDGKTTARIGRFVSMLGALMPVHVDGASVRERLPHRIDIEGVAGIPVVPGLGTARAWDWVTGGRIARRIGDGGAIGIAYGQRRDGGVRASEELGVDAGAALSRRTDAAARVVYDLVGEGLAEIAVTASHKDGALREEVFASQRSASHLLPATSLFSVIGDVPAQRAGTVVTWKAAPRLDVIAELAALRSDTLTAPDLIGRARLRLDDRGAGQLTGELRRSGVGDDMWSGARLAARVPVARSITVSTELELVIPDDPRGRGTAWPWGLLAAGWRRDDWEAAIAVEASSSPQYRSRVDGLLQLTRRWSAP